MTVLIVHTDKPQNHFVHCRSDSTLSISVGASECKKVQESAGKRKRVSIMEVRTSSRMYGAVDEPAHHSSLPRSDNGQDVTMTSEAHLLPSRVRERSSSRSWLAVALICALGIGTVAVTNRSGSSAGISSTMQQHPDLQERVSDSTRSEHQTGQPGLQDSTSGALEFHITNFYHTRDGKPGAQIPWLRGVKLAEPYMDTTLQVLNARDDHTYDWIIRSMSGDEEILATASGPEVVMLFTRLDENAVTMEEKDSTGRVTRELTEVVMVKYVRREIRTLTDEDREELLDSVGSFHRVLTCTHFGQESLDDTED